MALAYRVACDAIAKDDLVGLRAEISRDPTVVTEHWKPLVDASFMGRVDCVNLILEAGTEADIRGGGQTANTALTRVCQPHKTIGRSDAHVRVLDMLLRAGADPLLPGGMDELIPLHWAYVGGNTDFIDTLEPATLAALKKTDSQEEVFVYAAKHALAALRQFNAASVRAVRDRCGRNALHYVALADRYDQDGGSASVQCARYLCEEVGIDPTEAQVIPEGEEDFLATPLWWTLSRQSNHNLAKYLLDQGCDPTPCVFTVSFAGDEVGAELLDSHAADWNARFHGKTPLMDMVTYNRTKMIPWLIEHGADVSLADNNGRTVLHHAVLRGIKPDWCALLIEHGCNPEELDSAGESALDLALKKGRSRHVELLEHL